MNITQQLKGRKFCKWVNLKIIMPSKRSQIQKNILFPLYKMSRKGKYIETESRLVVALKLGLRMSNCK